MALKLDEMATNDIKEIFAGKFMFSHSALYQLFSTLLYA